jgi:hypothetical protein
MTGGDTDYRHSLGVFGIPSLFNFVLHDYEMHQTIVGIMEK